VKTCDSGRRVAVLLACSAAIGCGQSSGPGFVGGGSGGAGASSSSGGAGSSGASGSGGSAGGNGSSSGAGNGGFGTSSGGTGDGGTSGGNGCTGDATSFVYVLSSDDNLYSFAPDKKLFAKIGLLGCMTTMQPNSMAVDRNAVAWVNYVQAGGRNASAGVIFQVSTKDASCQPSPTMTLPSGWTQLGMAFSTNAGSGPVSETLFVSGNGTGMGLGSINLAAATLAPVGGFTGTLAGQDAELTGTGDGRLFGYFTTSPVNVAQIDKPTGATPNPVAMTGVSAPSDWAFSFWGGHFYLYTAPGHGNGSDVIDYDPTTGSTNLTYMTGIDFTIVGAGVSTCAPTVPPPAQ
jgi:hypothetical protein